MNGPRHEEQTDDGYLLIIDPPRGIGLICEPIKLRARTNSRMQDGASWRVISLFLRPSNAETADFTTDYGRN